MTDTLERIEQDYLDRLTERATLWQTRHPAEAKVIREEVLAGFRVNGKPEPEPGTLLWMMVESQVAEAVRIKNGWPTIRQFMTGQQPYHPPKLKPSPAERDLKALAAGDV